MIKTSFRLIFAVLAATAVLASSCTKEIPAGQDSDPKASQSEGSRVISVSFAPSTKTALGEDGLTPEFTGQNEWIKVSNSTMSENCKVTVSPSGRASITTSLNGALKAVYPAYTAKMDGSRISGIDIPSYQDGTFASANICMAEMEDEKEEGLTFHNKTALFAIIPPEGTAQLKVTSLRPVGNDGFRSGYALPISTGQEFDAITITATGKDSDGKVYLSLCPGVNLSDLSFEAEFSTTGTGSIKGISMKAIEEAEAENTTVGGTMYTINENNWHPYVTVGGHKWATMNVGAENSTDAGKYFAWGDTEGQIAKTEGQGAFDTPFDWAHAPFTDDGDYSSEASIAQVAAACPGNVLALQYDAANANWGGAWRMPTTDEYFSLAIACGWDPEDLPELPAVTASLDKGYYKLDKAQEILPEYSGFVGLLTIEDSEHKLFFPAAGGGGYNGTLEARNEYGFYYSSTYFSSYAAYTWVFTGTLYTNNTSSSRCDGYTVRAIIDDGASAPAPGKKEIVLWEGEAIADDWGNQPYLLSDTGLELKDANATVGQEVRFYITAIDDNWILKIHEGHWGPEYCGYCSVGNDNPSAAGYTEYDLDANGGYISLTLTQAMLDAAFTQQWWGGTFVADGDNVKITKITLY